MTSPAPSPPPPSPLPLFLFLPPGHFTPPPPRPRLCFCLGRAGGGPVAKAGRSQAVLATVDLGAAGSVFAARRVGLWGENRCGSQSPRPRPIGRGLRTRPAVHSGDQTAGERTRALEEGGQTAEGPGAAGTSWEPRVGRPPAGGDLVLGGLPAPAPTLEPGLCVCARPGGAIVNAFRQNPQRIVA